MSVPQDLASQLIQRGRVDELTLKVVLVHSLHVGGSQYRRVSGRALAYRFGRQVGFSGVLMLSM